MVSESARVSCLTAPPRCQLLVYAAAPSTRSEPLMSMPPYIDRGLRSPADGTADSCRSPADRYCLQQGPGPVLVAGGVRVEVVGAELAGPWRDEMAGHEGHRQPPGVSHRIHHGVDP